MGQKRRLRKRPCRICGKWFVPNPRLDKRQKTCGTTECQQRWHAKKCAEWNRKNRSYFKEIYISRRLESSIGDASCPTPSPFPASRTRKSSRPRRASPLHFPQEVVQEVIGVQQMVIIEYLVRLLMRSVQEVINSQRVDIHQGFRRLPLSSISRGDSQRPP
jgi:hypothetical protein